LGLAGSVPDVPVKDLEPAVVIVELLAHVLQSSGLAPAAGSSDKRKNGWMDGR
jgi:hypothetical protein